MVPGFWNFQKPFKSMEELTKNHQFGVGSLIQFFDFVKALVKGQNWFCEFLKPAIKGWKLVTINPLYNHTLFSHILVCVTHFFGNHLFLVRNIILVCVIHFR
jgi:hypothetical protein